MCLETTTRFVAAAADTQVVVVCVGGLTMDCTYSLVVVMCVWWWGGYF